MRHPLEGRTPHASTLCPFDVNRGNWKLTLGLASAQGAHASVNTSQLECRGVGFISVVTTMGVTTGVRGRRLCADYIVARDPFVLTTHTRTQKRVLDSPVSIKCCILDSVFFLPLQFSVATLYVSRDWCRVSRLHYKTTFFFLEVIFLPRNFMSIVLFSAVVN